MFSLYAPVIFELILRTLRILDQDALLELHGHDQQDRERWRSTISASCQLMMNMKIMAVTMLSTPQVDVQHAPGDQLGDALGVGGDARHDPADRRPAEVGERQLLQVVEHLLAQVVLDALAQDAGQVDEGEDADGLDEDQRAVGERRCCVSGRQVCRRTMPSSMIRLLR